MSNHSTKRAFPYRRVVAHCLFAFAATLATTRAAGAEAAFRHVVASSNYADIQANALEFVGIFAQGDSALAELDAAHCKILAMGARLHESPSLTLGALISPAQKDVIVRDLILPWIARSLQGESGRVSQSLTAFYDALQHLPVNCLIFRDRCPHQIPELADLKFGAVDKLLRQHEFNRYALVNDAAIHKADFVLEDGTVSMDQLIGRWLASMNPQTLPLVPLAPLEVVSKPPSTPAPQGRSFCEGTSPLEHPLAPQGPLAAGERWAREVFLLAVFDIACLAYLGEDDLFGELELVRAAYYNGTLGNDASCAPSKTTINLGLFENH